MLSSSSATTNRSASIAAAADASHMPVKTMACGGASAAVRPLLMKPRRAAGMRRRLNEKAIRSLLRFLLLSLFEFVFVWVFVRGACPDDFTLRKGKVTRFGQHVGHTHQLRVAIEKEEHTLSIITPHEGFRAAFRTAVVILPGLYSHGLAFIQATLFEERHGSRRIGDLLHFCAFFFSGRGIVSLELCVEGDRELR